MKHNEGYPMTREQFYDSQWCCVKLYIKNEDVETFKKACFNSTVRYIPVTECLKEEPFEGCTMFFTRHILQEDLFRLGKEFEAEKQKHLEGDQEFCSLCGRGEFPHT